MKNVFFLFILFLISSLASAETISSRDSSVYFLGSDLGASHIITTNPIQPYEPVYAWRVHIKGNGEYGQYGQNADLIGYTDANGTLEVVVDHIPNDFSLCGHYGGERVAVGSPLSPQSNALNFSIAYFTLVGPRPPSDFC